MEKVRGKHKGTSHPRGGTPRAGRRLDPAGDHRAIVVDAVGTARLAGDVSTPDPDTCCLYPLGSVTTISVSRPPIEADRRVPVPREIPHAAVASIHEAAVGWCRRHELLPAGTLRPEALRSIRVVETADAVSNPSPVGGDAGGPAPASDL